MGSLKCHIAAYGTPAILSTNWLWQSQVHTILSKNALGIYKVVQNAPMCVCVCVWM